MSAMWNPIMGAAWYAMAWCVMRLLLWLGSRGSRLARLLPDPHTCAFYSIIKVIYRYDTAGFSKSTAGGSPPWPLGLLVILTSRINDNKKHCCSFIAPQSTAECPIIKYAQLCILDRSWPLLTALFVPQPMPFSRMMQIGNWKINFTNLAWFAWRNGAKFVVIQYSIYFHIARHACVLWPTWCKWGITGSTCSGNMRRMRLLRGCGHASTKRQCMQPIIVHRRIVSARSLSHLLS